MAAVIDLCSQRVVGWAMGTTANAQLVTDALVMAFQRRTQKTAIPKVPVDGRQPPRARQGR